MNALLLKQGVAKSIAMWGTVFGFGIVNFFLLRHMMKNTPTPSSDKNGKMKQKVDARSSRKSKLKRIGRGGNQDESFFHLCLLVVKSFSSRNENLRQSLVPPNAF